jgi:lon-related putative ATP-dependent protease
MKQQLTIQQITNPSTAQDVRRLTPPEKQPHSHIIGQERGIKALQLGIGIRAHGFHIYVSGIHGTGKLTAVKNFVEEPAQRMPVPNDWCYVNNFRNLYEPRRLCLPPGKGIRFRDDLRNLVSESRHALIKSFESEDYISRRKKITDEVEQQQDALLLGVKERALHDKISIEETPVDILTVPIKEGRPMTNEEFTALGETEQQEIRRKQAHYFDEIKTAIREGRKLEKHANESILKLQKEVASFALENLFDESEEAYATIAEALQHLRDVKEDILANLGELLAAEKSPNAAFLLKKYEVNVLVDNSVLKGAPVVIELHPIFYNLIGRVEKEVQMGTWITDMTLIRKGSLHEANGGYLIIPVDELFKNPFSWETLKRALKQKQIVIEDLSEQWGFITAKTLKPEPIPLDVKVILIGDPMYYHLLYQLDPDFKELFKVKADFDSSMPRTDEAMSNYIGFCHMLTQKENLLPLTDAGIARVIEYGSRLADNQQKLSTRFGNIADIIREAQHYAMLDQQPYTDAVHVHEAIEEKTYRSNLIQERLNEMISKQQVMIDIRGEKVGQVNGLSVVLMGDIEFGIPNRITCTTSLGKEGIIAIEREAELSGPIHTKGVLILSGYLAEQYLQKIPACLNAQLVFEQNYSEIEGDSASSTELYALLSRLANRSIRQGIAVTGSVNQKGEVQAIGGVNEKIEGYFEVCRKIGLTGEQGVIIPAANISNLMLKQEVISAIEAKQFTIWAVDHVDEGIEILTGIKAGTTEEKGTLKYLVQQQLNTFADQMKAFSNE